MDLKKQRIEMAVTGLMLGLASYLQYIAYHTKARTNVQGMQSMTFPKIMIMDFLFVQIMDIAINSNTLYRMIGFKTKYRKMPSLFYQLWSFTKPPYLINWEWRIGMPIRA